MIKKIVRSYIIYKESTSDKKRLIEIIVVSVLILIIFLIKIVFNGFWIWGGNLAFAETGQFGDFVGGVIGTFFSGAGFYFLYVTLLEQRIAIDGQKNAFEKERFEAKFFDLIKLHRENVSEFKFEGKILDEDRIQWNNNTYENKAVFNAIYNQFVQCNNELKHLFKGAKRTYNPEYLKKISHLNLDNNRLNLLAKIDVCYSIIFYGVSSEGSIILYKKFRHKYKEKFINDILRYISLKPASDEKILKKWILLSNKSSRGKKLLVVNEIFDRRKKIIDDTNSKYDEITNDYHNKYIKYYGGHQFRLGHYYRHLYQTVKYVNNSDMTYKEKYNYVKILRAQLSTYEQMTLFLNSLSSMGYIWELEPEIDNDLTKYSKKDFELITKYNLIKNIPGEEIFGIPFRLFYPNVEYEGSELKRNNTIYK
jgi:hypothetical protein